MDVWNEAKRVLAEAGGKLSNVNKDMLIQKHGRIGAGLIVGAILVLIFLQVLLSVLGSVVPTAATSYYDFTQAMTNTTVLGSAPVTFAGNSVTYLGWFWVVGPFIMVVLIVLGIFGLSRGR